MGNADRTRASEMFGESSMAGAVPLLAPCAGPAFDEAGALALGESFAFIGDGVDAAEPPKDDDWIAGAYLVWEAYEKSWAEDSPALVRCEGFDIVIRMDGHRAGYWLGAIDVEGKVVETAAAGDEACEINEMTCYQWAAIDLGDLAGERLSDVLPQVVSLAGRTRQEDA